MISLSLPVPCFKCAVPETKTRSQHEARNITEWGRREWRTIMQALQVSCGEDFGEGSSPRDMLQMFITKNSKTHLETSGSLQAG